MLTILISDLVSALVSLEAVTGVYVTPTGYTTPEAWVYYPETWVPVYKFLSLLVQGLS